MFSKPKIYTTSNINNNNSTTTSSSNISVLKKTTTVAITSTNMKRKQCFKFYAAESFSLSLIFQFVIHSSKYRKMILQSSFFFHLCFYWYRIISSTYVHMWWINNFVYILHRKYLILNKKKKIVHKIEFFDQNHASLFILIRERKKWNKTEKEIENHEIGNDKLVRICSSSSFSSTPPFSIRIVCPRSNHWFCPSKCGS